MNYHVRITQRSKSWHDETKVDLTEEQLFSRIIKPYEEGHSIIINGKTITLNDIERIRISRSEKNSADLIEIIKMEDRRSSVGFIGGPSYEWRAAKRADDVTDEFIKDPPGHKKEYVKSDIGNIKDIVNSDSKIFIVHGHDDALKNELGVFLTDLGLKPIILHRQVDEGLTIIEKFEKNSDVKFAFILLTPDDIGYSVADQSKPESERLTEHRARQNVIFEFGFFIGKLGRSKVCCIYKEDVALPTDVSGILYKKVKDSIEEIGLGLIKELKNTGIKTTI